MAALSSLEELLEWDVAMKAQTATSKEMARRLRKVAELHNVTTGWNPKNKIEWCESCSELADESVLWPCPTARALAGEE